MHGQSNTEIRSLLIQGSQSVQIPSWACRSYPVHLPKPMTDGKLYRGDVVRHVKTFIIAGLSAALLAGSVSSADARWGHRGYYGNGGYYGRGGYYGGGPGLVGGVVIGALTLATLPFALLGAVVSPAPPPPRGYYGPSYGPAPYGYDAPPPPRGYNQQYDGPPAQQGYNQQYGPPPGYPRPYRQPQGYYDGN